MGNDSAKLDFEHLRHAWFIACESAELPRGELRARTLLGERVALGRDSRDEAFALEDRCLHRCAKLSAGRIENDRVVCPYHGWAYDARGALAEIPSGDDTRLCGKLRLRRFELREQDGYVWIRLDSDRPAPKPIPRLTYWNDARYAKLRYATTIEANVRLCLENFIDTTHSIYVHPKAFRTRSDRAKTARVRERAGDVHIEYSEERSTMGWIDRVLNPRAKPVIHRDAFLFPNLTNVEYVLGGRNHLSHAGLYTPIDERRTAYYSVTSLDFGWKTALAAPLVRARVQRVLAQDRAILENQASNLPDLLTPYVDARIDRMSATITRNFNAIFRGEAPDLASERDYEIEFRI